jgi:hypothetical protein
MIPKSTKHRSRRVSQARLGGRPARALPIAAQRLPGSATRLSVAAANSARACDILSDPAAEGEEPAGLGAIIALAGLAALSHLSSSRISWSSFLTMAP